MERDSQAPQSPDELKIKGLTLVNHITRETSSALLQQFFDELSNELLEFSQNSTDDHVYQYFYARAKLIRSRERLIKTFLHHLEQPLAKFGGERFCDETGLQDDADDLSLVEDEVMEEEVAITAIRQRSEARYRELLWKLNRQFAMLTAVREFGVEHNPIAPGGFCLALRKVMPHFTEAVCVKTATYKLFEQRVVNRLEAMYQHINRRLNDLGFVPSRTYNVVKARDNANLGRRGDNRGQRRRFIAPSDRSGAAYKQQLLAGLRGGQFSQPQYGAEDAGYSQDDLYQALDKVQELEWRQSRQQNVALPTSDGLQPRDIAQVTEMLLHRLTELLTPGDQAQLDESDMRTIDLVGMLFEYILNDDQLPDAVKALLSYLHTPLLKLAFTDRGFFQQAEHPARVLLNRLAEAGTKWVKADGKSEYGVYERMRESVERLLRDADKEARPFAEELLSLNAFLKRLELKIELMEKRAAEQAQGEDRRNEINRRVHRELNYRIGNRHLPSAILMFLLQPWTDYLCLLLLRFGEESDEWHDALDLVDDLLWGLQISGNADEKQRWRQHYPWIESMVQRGFAAIGYEEGSRRKMTSAIHHVYKLQLQDQEVRSAPEAVRSRLVRLAERRAGVQAEQESVLTPEEQQHLELLGQLPFGTWFEFESGRREKLVWYNLRTQQFLFVDQSGHRSGMRTGQDIARLMSVGTMRVLDTEDKPLVDRTLEQIQADLSDMAKSA